VKATATRVPATAAPLQAHKIAASTSPYRSGLVINQHHQRQAGAAAQQRRLRSQPGIAGMAVVAEQQGCAVATEEVPKLLGPPGGVNAGRRAPGRW